MSSTPHLSRRPSLVALGALLALGAAGLPAPAADHADAPILIDIGRHDARLTDLFAFTQGDDLVLALCANPAILGSVTSYRFPSDLVFRIYLDTDAKVDTSGQSAGRAHGSARGAAGVEIPGGVLLEPDKVCQDVRITVEFDADGAPHVSAWTNDGMDWKSLTESMRVFAGLRDDPFIRTPRVGKNVSAVVLQFPRSLVLRTQDTVLVWATSEIRGFRTETGEVQDTAARPLYNQFPENRYLNFVAPRDQWKHHGLPPDVLLLDTSKAVAWPNGRALTDDVVDLVGDSRVLADDAPYPTENDVPFLDAFPYLAPPHGQ